ncbi:hypothetical protein [Marinoscillum sp. MHG1-6]|uniref:hypothetical protein n=1 Tax=Marinoscillum sp. MHG1-6 TaxID=2959627 RepID=UPI002157C6BE|nr:hypothetical protein [Marinoscillum sp. MHG1-6]
MKESCVSGKRIYETQSEAEEALVEAWINFNFNESSGPRAIYQCQDCDRFHFTSQGEMNEHLKERLDNGYIEKQRRAREWERKLR